MTFRLLKKSFHIYRGNISPPDFHSFTSCRILNKLATEGSRAKLSTVLDCSQPLESRLLAGFYTTQCWLFHLHVNLNSDARGGGGYSTYPWVGRYGAAPHTLTLFKTNIANFPTHFKTEFRFLIPCLRHLTQFNTKIDKSLP